MGNGIDPRFDPAFQRGYKPKPGETAHKRVKPASGQTTVTAQAVPTPVARPAESLSAVSDEVVWADDEPELEQVTTPTPPAGQAESLETAAMVYDYREDAPALLAQIETAPRRNPYFLALWIMAIGFIVLAIFLYVMSVVSSYSGTSTNGADVFQLVFSQLGWMLATPLITVGLATLVLLVLIQALRHRSRR